MQRVLILKSESESNEDYASQLAANNYLPIFIPTLHFAFKNLEQLHNKLLSPQKYTGLIFTSPRCVDVVQSSLKGQTLPDKWGELHNYCVGEVTHDYSKSRLSGLNTLGKETGNANHLAEFIIKQFQGNKSLPFLFPCGNVSTRTLLEKLLAAGFLIDSCEAYETLPHPELSHKLSVALAKENVEYIVFFSPSGVTACLEYFVKGNVDLSDKKLVAIGHSTRKCMESEGLVVYDTAEKPSVQYLIKVLTKTQKAVVST